MAYRSGASQSTPGATITIAKPTGTVDGDVMVMWVGSDWAGQTFTWPAGWTAVPDTPIRTVQYASLGVAYRLASGEGASYDITVVGGNTGIGGILTFSGRDPTTPLHRSSVRAVDGTDPTPWDLPSNAFGSATATDGCDLVCIGWSDVNNTNAVAVVDHTPPAGYTERQDIHSTGYHAGMAATLDAVAAGATGSLTATGAQADSSALGTLVVVLALTPAGGGPPTPPPFGRPVLDAMNRGALINTVNRASRW